MYIVDSQIANLRKRCFQIKEILVNLNEIKRVTFSVLYVVLHMELQKNSWREGFNWCRKHMEEFLSLFSEDTGSRKMSKYYVCESECSISRNKYHEKVPSTRIRFCSFCLKTEIFAPFSKKLCVHALRFWIVFACLYENVILTENGTIVDGNVRFTSIQHRKVMVFKTSIFIHPDQWSKTGFSKTDMCGG